jgi:hypothetical protein
MSHVFRIGDRIIPSKDGLRTFPRWAGRQGTIVGVYDQNVWQVRWDGRAKVEAIHLSFIDPKGTAQVLVHIKSGWDL